MLSINLDLYSFQCESNMNDFCNAYNFSSLIKEPTSYKNQENPSSIDLILTNSPRSFRGSCVVKKTGLSNFEMDLIFLPYLSNQPIFST